MVGSIKFTKRLTSPFLEAVPPQIRHFDAHLYAVVQRKPNKIVLNHKYGADVRLDPCELNWAQKTITITIPYDINVGIESIDDLHPDFYEAVEVAFLTLMHNCLP